MKAKKRTKKIKKPDMAAVLSKGQKTLADDELKKHIEEKKPDSAEVTLTDKMLEGKQLHKALREFVAQQNEYAGHRVIAFADEAPNTFELRRPSGIMQLDLDTGGGLPAGGLSEVSGVDNSGKTHLILRYMLMHQLLYGDKSALAYACIDGSFDFRRAINMGLRISVPDPILNQWNAERRIRGFPHYTDEEWLSFKQQTGEFLILNGSTGEEILGTVLDCIKRNIFGIVAVDSISIILPDADADKTLVDQNKFAARATLITNFMRRYTPITGGLDQLNYTTLIFANQVRANQERADAPAHLQKYIRRWSATGAHSEKHTKLIDITLWGSEKIKKTVKGVESVVGKVTKYEIAKGKVGTHDNIFGEYPYYYDHYYLPGVDRFESVLLEGMRRGVVVEQNGLVNVLQPETGKPGSINGIPGLKNFKRMMEIDLEFELAVRREILASKGIMCLYR
jgi:RecA/RadA recombinase